MLLTLMHIQIYLHIHKQDSQCCDYGITGKKLTGGGDCIKIPGAEKKTSTANKGVAACIAGGQKGLVTTSGTTQATVCCKHFLLFDNQLKVTSLLNFFSTKFFFAFLDNLGFF